MPECRHGQYTKKVGKLTGSEEAKALRHEAKCRKGGVTFGHPGTILGIFRVICCSGCGKQIS